MRPDQERAAMRQAGLVPIPLEIEPGSGCPGGVLVGGKAVGMCVTCSRLGGRELTPAVRLVNGEPKCPNFHGGIFATDAPGRETAERGGVVAASTPMGGA